MRCETFSYSPIKDFTGILSKYFHVTLQYRKNIDKKKFWVTLHNGLKNIFGHSRCFLILGARDERITQLTFTCSKFTRKTPEKV